MHFSRVGEVRDVNEQDLLRYSALTEGRIKIHFSDKEEKELKLQIQKFISGGC